MRKIILLAATILLMTGCDNEETTQIYTTNDGVVYERVIIDSCEYVHGFRRLAHKGNCKFCAERRKQELKELVKELKGK